MEFIKRSVDDIFQEILAEKENYSSLDVLTDQGINDEQSFLDVIASDSKVSIWILLAYLVSRVEWATDNIMELQVKELEVIRDSSFIGNKDWYAYIAKQFQYGDEVIIDDKYTISYAVIDTSKKIIGSTSVDEIGGKVLLKIRGRDADLLTTDELNSFVAYMNNVKFAGTKLFIKNSDADKLKLVANVVYTGTYELSSIITNVEAAINGYIANLPFDSYLVTNDLIQSVKNVDGIIDIEVNTIQCKTNTGPYSDVIHRYNAEAGYLSVDTDFPLSTFLTYSIG